MQKSPHILTLADATITLTQHGKVQITQDSPVVTWVAAFTKVWFLQCS